MLVAAGSCPEQVGGICHTPHFRAESSMATVFHIFHTRFDFEEQLSGSFCLPWSSIEVEKMIQAFGRAVRKTVYIETTASGRAMMHETWPCLWEPQCGKCISRGLGNRARDGRIPGFP